MSRRLDALTPPAVDVLVRQLYSAVCASYRGLSLREFAQCDIERFTPDALSPALVAKIDALDRRHGVYSLQAQIAALISEAERDRRLRVLMEADGETPDGETPISPALALLRRLDEAQLETLTAPLPDGTPPDNAVCMARLLELAPALGLDVDAPMEEQGL